MVNNIWKVKVNGFLNFQILKKMQMLKKELKKKYMSTHIEDNLRQAEHHLAEMQNLMHSDPMNPLFVEHEHKAAQNLREIKNDYAMYTSQRAKMNRLKFGDENTKLFHNNIKQRK